MAAVTGATGFIGGRLVERLLENGINVTCLLRSAAAKDRISKTGATLIKLDLADAAAVTAALEGMDYIFHCAYDSQDPAWNVEALHILIKGCRTHRSRLVHVSSYVVYDLPMKGEVTEETPAAPVTHGYSHTKLQLERILLKATLDDGLLGTIIQPTNVYGPYSRPWTIDPANMLRYGTVILPDRGEGLCNAVYVDDVVNAMILAADHPNSIGQRFLVSGPEPITWSDFYEKTANSIGVQPPLYRPANIIQRDATPMRKLMRLFTDPEEVLRRVTRTSLGKAIFAGLQILPHRPRKFLRDRLQRPIVLRRGYLHTPNLAHLRFLQSQIVICSTKAKTAFGYCPQFDFSAGMTLTADYLQSLGQIKPQE